MVRSLLVVGAMLRNVKTSVLPLCSIVTGIGLLAAGCSETESTDLRSEVPYGCVADEETFAIDHSELQAVDGVAPSAEEAREHRWHRARALKEGVPALKVKQCGEGVHVTFTDDGTGYKNGELKIVDAYRAGNALEGVVEVTLHDESKLELSFHATALR
jgi:hypothetical protein